MAGINKKGPVLASARLARAMDKLTKAALIDLVVDLLRRTEGADVSEWHLCKQLEAEYLPPVLRERGDRMPALASIYFAGASLLRTIGRGLSPSEKARFAVASLIHEGLVESQGDSLSLTDAGRELLRQIDNESAAKTTEES